MKTVKFFRTINENVLNEYGCTEDGNQSGEYVRASSVDALKPVIANVIENFDGAENMTIAQLKFKIDAAKNVLNEIVRQIENRSPASA